MSIETGYLLWSWMTVNQGGKGKGGGKKELGEEKTGWRRGSEGISFLQ